MKRTGKKLIRYGIAYPLYGLVASVLVVLFNVIAFVGVGILALLDWTDEENS